MPLNWPAPMPPQGSLGANDPRQAFASVYGGMRGNSAAQNWPQPMPSAGAPPPAGAFAPPGDRGSEGSFAPPASQQTSVLPTTRQGDQVTRNWNGGYRTQTPSAPTSPMERGGYSPAVMPSSYQSPGQGYRQPGGIPPASAPGMLRGFDMSQLQPILQQLLGNRGGGMGMMQRPGMNRMFGQASADYGNYSVGQPGGGAGNMLPAYTTSLGGAPPAGYTSDWQNGGGGGAGATLPAYATVTNSGVVGSSPNYATPGYGGYGVEGAQAYGGGEGNALPAYTTSVGGSPPAGYTSDARAGSGIGGGAGNMLPGYGVLDDANGAYSLHAPGNEYRY